MKFSKGMIRFLLVTCIILALYCLIVLILPFERTTVFWLAFCFTAVAIIAQFFILSYSFTRKGARSKYYGIPIARVGLLYLGIQLVVGFIFMLLENRIDAKWAVLLFLVIMGAAAVGLIAVDTIREEIERQDRELRDKGISMRSLYSQMATIADQCPDPEIKASLKKLADNFKYSDPQSGEATQNIELSLKNMVHMLQMDVLEGKLDSARSLVSHIDTTLAERNRLCKLNK